MQKIGFFGRRDAVCPLPKTTNWMFLMRVSSCVISIIFLMGHLLVASPGIGQRNADTKLNLDFRNTAMKKVFKAIESKADVVIMYEFTHKEVNKKVDISVKDVSVRDVLNRLLNNTGLEWKIRDNIIRIQEASDTTVTTSGALKYPAISPSLATPPITVRGRIVNENNEPVMVSVTIKGTAKGTTTDEEGNFEIINVEDNAVLIISGIAIETQEFHLKGQVSIIIKVVTKIGEEESVTVSTGYWTTSKRLSTGNISKVTAKDIEKQPVTNPLLALQGRVPGLEISPNTGVPGGAIKFTIRGRNSLRNNTADETANSPLIVVDGIPIDPSPVRSGALPTGSTLPQGYDPLSTLNPANIESVEVLKDADATAIYGSRGANGVLLITTKKSNRARKTNIDINVYSGIGKIVNRMDLLNTQEYVALRKEAFANDSTPINWYDFDVSGRWDTSRYTDWQKVLLGGTSRITDVQAGISSGNANTTFKFDAAYHKENVVYSGDFGYERLSGSLNINHRSPDQKLNVGITVNYGFNKNKLFEDGGFISQALTLAPNAPALYDADGKLNWDIMEVDGYKFNTFDNPLAKLKRTNESNARSIISNAVISYKLMPGLTARVNAGLNDLSGDEILKFPIDANAPVNIGSNTTGSNTFGNNNRHSWIIEPQMNYLKRIDDHSINILTGLTIQETISEYKSIQGFGYVSDVLLDNLNAAAQSFIAVDIYNQYKYLAYYMRVAYNWKEKYLINFSGRRDGSSRFSPTNRYGNFGAVGLAWVFSEEKFIKRHLQFLSFAKIRGSFGVTGNDQIGDYRFYNTYRIGSYPYDGFVTLSPAALFNPNYKWETTKKAEIGIELGFFNDRLSFQTNYYRNTSSNQLVQYQLPSITGFDGVLSNFNATVQNSGWESSIIVIPVKKKFFYWETSLNISANRNKLVAFPGLESSSYATLYKVGKPLSVIRWYSYDKVDPATGKYIVKDDNNDGVLNDQDKKFFTFQTRYYGGLNNTLKFHSVELSFLLQFTNRNTLRYHPGMPGTPINQTRSVLNRWQKPGDITNVPRVSVSYNNQLYNDHYVNLSDYMIEDASFVRLKTLGISYIVPEKINKRIGLDQVRFYIQGQNLLTFTKNKSFDPETGISLPPLRMLSLGIQLRL